MSVFQPELNCECGADTSEPRENMRLIAGDPIRMVRTVSGRAAKPSLRATSGDWSAYVCCSCEQNSAIYENGDLPCVLGGG